MGQPDPDGPECMLSTSREVSTSHAKDEYVLGSPSIWEAAGGMPFAVAAVSRRQPSAVTCSHRPGPWGAVRTLDLIEGGKEAEDLV